MSIFFSASEKNALHRIFAWLDATREDYLRSASELRQFASETLDSDIPEPCDEDGVDDCEEEDLQQRDWRIVGSKRKFKVRIKAQKIMIFRVLRIFLYYPDFWSCILSLLKYFWVLLPEVEEAEEDEEEQNVPNA